MISPEKGAVDKLAPDEGAQAKEAAFVGDVIALVGGTTIAQAVAALASPVITRLFGPEAFGVYAIFLSLAGILGVIVCLRYEFAIMLPRSDEEGGHLLWLSLLIVGAFSLCTIPIVVIFPDQIASLFNTPALGRYLWLLPPFVFAAGLFQALNYWNSRTRHFGRLSIAQVTRSLTITGTQLGTGLTGAVSGGSLIIAALIGQFTSSLILGWQIWRDDSRLLMNSLNPAAIRKSMWRYRNFPLIDSWSALLSSIASQLPVLLLSMYFSSVIVGYYSLGMMILHLPITLIGSAVTQVFFSNAAAAVHMEGKALARVVESTVIQLAALGLAPFLVLFLIGQEAFTVIFGAQWGEAGLYVQILTPWMFASFFTTPVSTLYSVLERQRDSLVLNLAVIGPRIGSLVLGGNAGEPLLALSLFSFVGVAFVGGSCLWLLYKAEVSARRMFLRMIPYILASSPIGIILIALKWYFAVEPVLLVIISVLLMPPYFIFVLRNNPELRAPIMNMIGRTRLSMSRR